MLRCVPAGTRRGSSMLLASASARHRVASPYSRKAIEARLSPAETRWLRVALREPEVGFCPCGSVGTSSRETVHTARIGLPSGRNMVNLALTDLTTATMLTWEPQPKITHGGDGFFDERVFSVGPRQAKSDSTSLTTSPDAESDWSRKSSRSRARGSGPMNSGMAVVFDPLRALRSHLALFLTVYSFGLNWKVISPFPTRGELITLDTDGGFVAGDGGSTTMRWAFSSFPPPAGEVAMSGPGQESVVGQLEGLGGHLG